MVRNQNNNNECWVSIFVSCNGQCKFENCASSFARQTGENLGRSFCMYSFWKFTDGEGYQWNNIEQK